MAIEAIWFQWGFGGRSSLVRRALARRAARGVIALAAAAASMAMPLSCAKKGSGGGDDEAKGGSGGGSGGGYQNPVTRKITRAIPPPASAPASEPASNAGGDLHLTSPSVVVTTEALSAATTVATVSGSCTEGLDIELGGMIAAGEVIEPTNTLKQRCQGGSYRFRVAKIAEAVYDITARHVDPASLRASQPAVARMIRDVTAPEAVVVRTPTSPSVRNSLTTMAVAGTCEREAVVQITIDTATTEVSCVDGSFARNLTVGADGVYAVDLSQKDAAGNQSRVERITWRRDTALPPTPTITSNLAGLVTRLDTQTLAGSCVVGLTVRIVGGLAAEEIAVPVGSLETACGASGAYEFTLRPARDGAVALALSQYDAATEQLSPAVSVAYTLDRVAPAPVVIRQPAAADVFNGDALLIVAGSCEPSAAVVVTMTGQDPVTATCPATGLSTGQFTTTLVAVSDGRRDITVHQIDQAGNDSASVLLSWLRDTAVPRAPVVTSPAMSQVATRQSTLEVLGSCDDGLTVAVTAVRLDAAASAQIFADTAACQARSFRFTLTLPSDGAYEMDLNQRSLTGTPSANTRLTVIRDTQAPAAVQLSTPTTTSPQTSNLELTLAGSCETGGVVEIVRGQDAAALSTTELSCLDSVFTTALTGQAFGLETILITPRDAAGNRGDALTVSWLSASAALALAPVTLMAPAAATVTTASPQLTVAGQCLPTLSVRLTVRTGGVLVHEDAAACSDAGVFSLAAISPADGFYNVAVSQVDGAVTSAERSVAWTVDTVVPVVTLTQTPPAASVSADAVFSFTVSEGGAVTACAVDNAAWAACQSPYSLSSLTAGAHHVRVRATDAAGNVSAAVLFDWTVELRSTIALYHVNQSAPLADAGGYSAALASPLTAIGTYQAVTAGRFSQAVKTTSTQYLSAAHQPATHALARSRMTIEAFVKLTSNPDTVPFTIAAKSGGAGNLGWKFQMIKDGGSSQLLTFAASLNGTTFAGTATSSRCEVRMDAFMHVAVTWTSGVVSFYCAGVSKGTGSVGGSGAQIFATTAPLTIGSLGGSQPALATLDELRWSSVVRYVGAFTPRASEFVGD